MIKVELIDYMGNDMTAYNAARTSFNKADPDAKLTRRAQRLIRQLGTAEPRHWTPFGHATLTIAFQAPIYIHRQLYRSVVGFTMGEQVFPMSEVSRRYVSTRPEFTMPDVWYKKPDKPRMGHGEAFDSVEQQDIASIAFRAVDRAVKEYETLIIRGVCPEQARVVLPLCIDTQWWWTGSVEAFARVCRLRLGEDVQSETRQIAELIDCILRELFPYSWNALTDPPIHMVQCSTCGEEGLDDHDHDLFGNPVREAEVEDN